MKRRTAELQIFSLSFLDLLSCGLGGILLLYLALMTQSSRKAEIAAAQTASLQAQAAEAQADLSAATAALAQAAGNQAKLDEANRHLRSAQSALVGLKGEMKNVVFVFDHSGSMATSGFENYRVLLKQWVTQLPFERFNVIMFCNRITPFRKQLVADTKAGREEAVLFIDGFKPEGSTDTLQALRDAIEMSGVDTIVLMSDGAPNSGAEPVLEWVRGHNPNRVVINTVAMGNYFRAEYGAFLQTMAAENQGMFIGR